MNAPNPSSCFCNIACAAVAHSSLAILGVAAAPRARPVPPRASAHRPWEDLPPVGRSLQPQPLPREEGAGAALASWRRKARARRGKRVTQEPWAPHPRATRLALPHPCSFRGDQWYRLDWRRAQCQHRGLLLSARSGLTKTQMDKSRAHSRRNACVSGTTRVFSATTFPSATAQQGLLLSLGFGSCEETPHFSTTYPVSPYQTGLRLPTLIHHSNAICLSPAVRSARTRRREAMAAPRAQWWAG